MLLATTALRQYWKQNEELILLGEWCLSKRDIQDTSIIKTLPYHWQDRKKLECDYYTIEQLYEKTIVTLSEQLNYVHGASYPTKYYRILLGFWLSWFISALFDRYESLLVAQKSGKVTNTIISHFETGKMTPADYSEFSRIAVYDDYNHFLYSRIIQITNMLPHEVAEHVKTDCLRPTGNNSRWFERILHCWDKIIPDRYNKIVFNRPMGLKDLFHLQLNLGQLPYSGTTKYIRKNSTYNPSLRKKITFHTGETDFERILLQMLPEQIPLGYVEEFNNNRLTAIKTFPKNPKLIVSSTGIYHDEYFKFWAAEKCAQGVKLLQIQHGGGYGIAKFIRSEDHELSIAHTVYSWGWQDEKKNVKALPAPKLCKNISLKSTPEGPILHTLMDLPRYSYWLYSVPTSSYGCNQYLRDQIEFLKNLSPEVFKLINVRPYPTDYGNNFKEIIAKNIPDIKISPPASSLPVALRQCRLFIGTYNATTYLETLSANYPTVLFWNPASWEVRSTFTPFLDELKRVNIFHDTPRAAASHINQIADNVMAWWNDRQVQAIRKDFCENYALVKHNWINCWANELKKHLFD